MRVDELDDSDALIEPILQRRTNFVLGSRSLGKRGDRARPDHDAGLLGGGEEDASARARASRAPSDHWISGVDPAPLM